MWSILQPPKIHFGKGVASNYDYPNDILIITSRGAKSRGWTDYLKIKKVFLKI